MNTDKQDDQAVDLWLTLSFDDEIMRGRPFGFTCAWRYVWVRIGA
jgi:hypothetical protein